MLIMQLAQVKDWPRLYCKIYRQLALYKFKSVFPLFGPIIDSTSRPAHLRQTQRFTHRKEQQLSEANVTIELERYLIGRADVYMCKIVDRKISKEHVFFIADGGMHHHLAASGNFGQIIRKNYPVLIGNKMGSTDTETVSIVGPLCTPLDILGDKMELPKADIGDLAVILQSGAYGFTASPQDFLSHPAVVEVLV